MRYLGIDYGEKRIGLSLSDEEGEFAFPYGVIAAGQKAVSEICGIIKKESVKEIALGLPQNFDRKDTEATKRVRTFAAELKEASDTPVKFVDETLSTKEVIKSGASSRKMRDASAAALILGTFLNRKKREGVVD